MRFVVDKDLNVIVKAPKTPDLLVPSGLIATACAGNWVPLRVHLRGKPNVCKCCVEEIIKESISVVERALENVQSTKANAVSWEILPWGSRARKLLH